MVELNGRLNKCGVISPRYDLKIGDFEKFVYHILPSRQFGKVILTTTYGIMDHEEAKRKHYKQLEKNEVSRVIEENSG